MNYGYLDYQEWCKEIDSKLGEEDKINKIVNNNFEESIEKYRQKHGNFWYCSSVDTWVNLEIKSIPSLDNINNLILVQPINYDQTKQECMQTLLGGDKQSISIDEYHDKYCRKVGDKWVYISLLDLDYDNNAGEETEDDESDNELNYKSILENNEDHLD